VNTPIAFSEEERRLRADLAEELGFHPATLDPDDLARHRRLNAALDLASSQQRISRKYAHLSEERRQRDVEQRGREEVADLYE